jgi:glyoxylase-like metal-dependent hydrolase (beta-lactamase superfamily II)
MDALIFFAAEARILISGDALWERGLGFVWPQPLHAAHGNSFIHAARVALDAIEKLDPAIVVPGHGAPFSNVASALGDARGKLAAFERDPAKNARHAAKSLFVFALLDKGRMKVADVPTYLESVPVYRRMREEFSLGANDEFAAQVLKELLAARAVKVEDGLVVPTMRA